MGIYTDFTTFFICKIPAHYMSTASDIRKLPITDGLLYINVKIMEL